MNVNSVINRLVALALTVVSLTTGSPVSVESDAQALIYLTRYGYVDRSTETQLASTSKFANLKSFDDFKMAVMEFQAFAGLNQTGTLDPETIKLMNTPRCGVRDFIGPSGHRSKRYALQGSRWRVKDLTYRISRYPSKLKKLDVDIEIARAFDVWAKATQLNFIKRDTGRVHIEIRFENYEHGDGDPFDGPGGTLAHAYFPIYGGDAHFDDAETWTINSYKGTNLYQVAAHEFGHSLGLSHSDIRSALMAPFYRGYEPTLELDVDDILAIQALYGRPPTSIIATTTTKKPKPPQKPISSELCANPTFDTIFTGPDANTYVFKGDRYWKLDADKISSGYPRSIWKDWGGLPGNIKAAFTWTNGRLYFFKNNLYWRFTNMRMDHGYPKPISTGFPGVPDNFDTAFVWSGNGKIYFFKGSQYWRFDPSQRPPIKSSYPKSISNWEGLPVNMQSAFQYSNGYTYFFKNGEYWRFNDRSFKVDEGDPAFPRAVASWWFGCPELTNRLKVENDHNAFDFNDQDEDIIDADLDSSYHLPNFIN
ncbi:matrix metalloproteinase-24-like isoform X2 [Artemia franciscana]|uniref:Peptidase metallopeptidase domain-containing protein n=1 Tax=Artemia franciscana TaxID=6661 RepID=A0AA88L7C8_ARTSF|nr:hypothetical protein QYM36_005201 [Artemia franciscana]